MIRRLTLLLVVMAIPVLTALGTQQLARTTAPPQLPTEPATSDSAEYATPEEGQDSTTGPRSGSVAAVIPGSVDENGDVTDPGVGSDDDNDDDHDDDVDPDELSDDTTDDSIVDDSDDDADGPDERPETGTVDR